MSRRDWLIATLRAFDRVKTGGSWAILLGYDLPKLRAELDSLHTKACSTEGRALSATLVPKPSGTEISRVAPTGQASANSGPAPREARRDDAMSVEAQVQLVGIKPGRALVFRRRHAKRHGRKAT